MNAKQLELVKELNGILIAPYGGSIISVDLDRDGNKLYNKEKTIEIDIEQIESRARSTQGVFKDIAEYVMIAIINDEKYFETDEHDNLNWAIDEEYDFYVMWNKELRSSYNYKSKNY